MKNKVFLLSSLVLLSMSALVGCGNNHSSSSSHNHSTSEITSNITTSENNKTSLSEETTNQNSSSVSSSESETSSETQTTPVETDTTSMETESTPSETESTTETTTDTTPDTSKIEIKLLNNLTSINVGEEDFIRFKVLNNDNDLPVEVVSSDENIASIVEVDQSSCLVKAHKPGQVTVTISILDKKVDVALQITTKETVTFEAYTKVADEFVKGSTKEHDLKSGSYSIIKENARHIKLLNEETSFEVFNNDKVRLVTKDKGSYRSTTTTCIGLANDDLVFHQTKQSKDGNSITDETRSINIGTQHSEFSITKAEADLYVKGIDLSLSGDARNIGIISHFFDEHISNNNAYQNKYDSFKLTQLEEFKFQLKGNGDKDSQFAETTLDFILNPDGNGLASFAFKENRYYVKKDSDEKGGFANSISISATFNYDERVASGANFANFERLYFTNYEAGFFDSLTGEEPVQMATVGKPVYLKVKSGEPASALASVDHLSVIQANPISGYTYKENGEFIFNNAGTYNFKVKNSTGVIKTISIYVKELTIDYLEVYGLENKLELGIENPFTISIEPYELSDTPLNVTVSNNGECDAVIKHYKQDNYYTIMASKAGTAIVTITGEKYVNSLGQPKTLTVNVEFGSAEAVSENDIAAGLAGRNFQKDGMFNANNSFMFVYNENTNGGTYKFIYGSLIGEGEYQVTLNENVVSINITNKPSNTMKISKIEFAPNETDELGLPDFSKLIVTYKDNSNTELTMYLIDLI